MKVREEIKKFDFLEGCLIESSTDERHLIVEKIRRWGGSASNALLDPACKLFIPSHIDGLLGYRLELGCAIVLGDPVCAPANIPILVHAFNHFCKVRGWKIIYTIASEQFAKWVIGHQGGALVEFGEELILDPHSDPRAKTGVNASLVRRKVRHALNENVKVQEYKGKNQEIEKEIEQVGQAWLNSRRGPQIYISHVNLFENRFGKRWFYAQQEENIIGTLVLNQLQARQGWLLNHLMITPQAPHGTPELLVISALEALQQEGCHFITFGNSPGKELGEIVGLNKINAWLARRAYKIANKIFHLDGKQKFWGKFHPESERSYLIFSNSHISFRELWGLMRALNVSLN
jgi:lysylphosphatidylglycerol synthetase-like protein (DUF2156 family)